MNPTLVITNQSLVPRTCPQGGARHGLGGLIPTKRWFSPPNTFRYIPGWEGLKATTVVQPTINLKSWRRPIGLRVLRHDVEERHSSRSVYNANHVRPKNPFLCPRGRVARVEDGRTHAVPNTTHDPVTAKPWLGRSSCILNYF